MTDPQIPPHDPAETLSPELDAMLRRTCDAWSYGGDKLYAHFKSFALAAKAAGAAEQRAKHFQLDEKAARNIVYPALVNREAGGDHACARCHPHSEILSDGFTCVRHRLEDWLSARLSPPADTAGGKGQ